MFFSQLLNCLRFFCAGAAASPAFYGKCLRAFCQIEPFPTTYPSVTVDLKLPGGFSVTQPLAAWSARDEQHFTVRRVALGGQLVGGEDLGDRCAVGLGKIPKPFLRAFGAQDKG